MKEKVIKFCLIGTVAMIIHWLTVAITVSLNLAPTPLIANIFGFITAFQFSYYGHKTWTFNQSNITHDNQTLIKFFLVSSNSFILNELMYYVLLNYTSLHYLVSLAIVLISVSAITFVFSNNWAFK
jgi:putative flippase GtrA